MAHALAFHEVYEAKISRQEIKQRPSEQGDTGRVNPTYSQGWGDSYIPPSSSFTIPPPSPVPEDQTKQQVLLISAKPGDGENLNFQIAEGRKVSVGVESF